MQALAGPAGSLSGQSAAEVPRAQLLAHLQAWCHRAEESGIAALQEFSMKLRMARD